MNENNHPYISVIRLPIEHPFAAIASWDHYAVHQTLCKGYGDRASALSARILFRFDIEDETGFLFVQTLTRPDWTPVRTELEAPVAGPQPLVWPALEPGARFRFRLLARPTKRIGARTSPDRGRRVAITDEHEQRTWIARKGKQHGFDVTTCTMAERLWHDSKTAERLANGLPKPLAAVLYDGELCVTDAQALRLALCAGIGTQKAYGFGLLSVVLA